MAERTLAGRPLVRGDAQVLASGPVLALAEPLSFWGGLDAATGEIVDARHPQLGAQTADTVLVMPSGRGSSSASSVLVEAVRLGTAPAAIVLLHPDEIIALGAIVAALLYERVVPVVVLDEEGYRMLCAAAHATVAPDGVIVSTD